MKIGPLSLLCVGLATALVSCGKDDALEVKTQEGVTSASAGPSGDVTVQGKASEF